MTRWISRLITFGLGQEVAQIDHVMLKSLVAVKTGRKEPKIRNTTEMQNENAINLNGAAIVCAHVAKSIFPIVLAARDKATMPEDTGWQFLCNSVDAEDMQEAEVWSLSEVVELEPSLAPFMNCAAGTELIRDDETSSWRSVGDVDCAIREVLA